MGKDAGADHSESTARRQQAAEMAQDLIDGPQDAHYVHYPQFHLHHYDAKTSRFSTEP